MADNKAKKVRKPREKHLCTVCGAPCRPRDGKSLCYKCSPDCESKKKDRMQKNIAIYHKRIRVETLLEEILSCLKEKGVLQVLAPFKDRIEADTEVRFGVEQSVTSTIGKSNEDVKANIVSTSSSPPVVSAEGVSSGSSSSSSSETPLYPSHPELKVEKVQFPKKAQ
jgi:hypothetical protein